MRYMLHSTGTFKIVKNRRRLVCKRGGRSVGGAWGVVMGGEEDGGKRTDEETDTAAQRWIYMGD